MTANRTSRLTNYIFKNLLRMLLVLTAVSALSFALTAASPVDPVKAYLGEVGSINSSDENLAKFRSYFGSDIPPAERYLNWAVGFTRGNMGQSLIYRQPVSAVIGAKFINSMTLMITAWLLSGLLAFTLGVTAGVFRDSLADRIIKTYALFLASIPTFWLAIIMLMIFSVWLKIFPIGLSVPLGILSSDATIFDTIHHLILPALTLSITGVASITLHTREKMIDIMSEDYILNARARGQSLWHIVRHHGLRNVMIPAITLQFASVSEIFGGSILVEQVFSYPGLGQAAVAAGLGGDTPLLLGIAVISAAVIFVGNFTANILYGIIDPKIRRGGDSA